MCMVYGYIYKITNLVNGKAYIGQTTQSVDRRWIEHKTKTKRGYILTRAILKYGKDKFRVETLHEACDQATLNHLEMDVIQSHDTVHPNGYNIRHGGAGGGQLGEKTKKAISESLSRYFSNPENRAAAAKHLKGRKNLKLSKKVRCVETGQVFESYADASEWVGSSRGSPKIKQATEGKKPQYKGYRWEKVATVLRDSSNE